MLKAQRGAWIWCCVELERVGKRVETTKMALYQRLACYALVWEAEIIAARVIEALGGCALKEVGSEERYIKMKASCGFKEVSGGARRARRAEMV